VAKRPDAPQWTLLRRLADVAELQELADDPPSALTDALAPVLCPTLAWVRMFDQKMLPAPGRAERGTWSPSEAFKTAQRALQNGWYEDALESFRKSTQDNPEDFVSLFGYAQLVRYYEGDPEAALGPLERAARYAVPVGAKPWMKRFAAEAFISRADLLSALQQDYGLAHQHLSNAEEHVGPNPDIDLARARIAARTGSASEVSKHVTKAIGHGWYYALQVALDPAFPAEIADAVLESLDAARESAQSGAREKAASCLEAIDGALAEPDDDIEPQRLADAKRRLTELRTKAEALSKPAEGSLLSVLSMEDRVADLSVTVKRAAAKLGEERAAVRAERDRIAFAEEMTDLQARREELNLKLQHLMAQEATIGERIQQEMAEAVAKARTSLVRNGVRRCLAWVIPVFILTVFYHFTEIRFSPSFSFGLRGTAPAGEEPGATERKAPTHVITPGAPAPSRSQMGGRFADPSLADEEDGGAAPAVPPGGGPAPASAAEDADEDSGFQASYHRHDRLVWFVFFVYVLGVAGVVGFREWGELQTMMSALEKKYTAKREEDLHEIARQKAPVEAELKRTSARLEELRSKL